MLPVIICFLITLGATVVNILMFFACERRLKAAQKLHEADKRARILSVQQRQRICKEICRYKNDKDISIEDLEWYCEICPLNTCQ
ncbi:MAG: hypothetical protein J6S67_11860 [Methanobrevibacter sp.]|nr:hypothetical protein [Methanobrevibacter sp.]